MEGYARAPALPRPLTQMFNDNKKLYEELMQGKGSSPDLSPLYLKLRIQKDRLIAWGIQWVDRSKSGDMDGSLGRAGINELVASIMDSIKQLLEDAESLTPSSAGATSSASEKGKMRMPQPSPDSIRKLEEINRNLTTSIDTLCDLSRTRLEPLPEEMKIRDKAMKEDVKQYVDEKARMIAAESLAEAAQPPRYEDPTSNDLTDAAFIEPSLFSEVTPMRPSHSSPPSYESILTSSEDRVVAHFTVPRATPGQRSGVSPVLLDYRRVAGVSGRSEIRPNNARFEKILLAHFNSPAAQSEEYSGFLKLAGWTRDPAKSRYAFVYNVPQSGETELSQQDIQPRSLLSFLQNGGDSDSSNLPPLEHRFRLASNVALSVSHLLELGIVHGNLNSTNVVFFLDRNLALSQDKVWKSSLIRRPYLTGLHHLGFFASAAERNSPLTSLYQPPNDDYGPTRPFDAMHDLYSLGLVLLEIGLWMPIGKFMKSKYSRKDFKTRLQSIYLKKLSAKCGNGYMQAVYFCMTAIDHPVRTAEARVSLMAKFKEKVVDVLQRCCLLDNDQTPVPVKESGSTATAAAAAVAAAAVSSEASASQAAFDGRSSERLASIGMGKATEPSLSLSNANATLSREPSGMSAVEKTQQMSVAPQETDILAATKSCVTVWSHDIPALYQQYWQGTMYPRLEKILRRAISRWESYSIDIFMAGEDSDTARPTLYMECTSTKKVRRILQHLNKDLRLFDIKVVPGQIVRSKARRRKSAKKAKYFEEQEIDELNPHFQQKPLSGASIGAFLREQHLPPVSFGGTVLVDGEPFGMSVHHMLEDEDEIELGLENVIKLQRSMAHADNEPALQRQESHFSIEASSMEDDDEVRSVASAHSDASSHFDENSPEHLYPFDIEDPVLFDDTLDVDDHDDDFWLENDFELDAMPDEPAEEGDTAGIRAGSGDDLFVTQPALDDVGQGFFPSEEDKDFEHLCSHTFGHVHASSGLRRAQQDDLIHEIDWALIRINATRMADPHTVVPPTPGEKIIAPGSAQGETRARMLVPSAALPNRAVHCNGRTSGYATGTILPAMRLVRMPGRVSPSHSWQVRGKFGAGGDSGAWVIDSETGGVCGHVLAYSESSGVAYIAPMDVMMDDMQRTLGKRVSLPGQTDFATESARPNMMHSMEASAGAGLKTASDLPQAAMLASTKSEARHYTTQLPNRSSETSPDMRGRVRSMYMEGGHINRMSNSHVEAQC